MNALSSLTLSLILTSPTLAPVPQKQPPDPLGKAAMGVAAEESTLKINTVYPNMPAGKAGVRVGDRIVRVGSISPNTFSEVINQVTSFRPGATLEMEIDRDGERKVLKLTLVARPPEFDNRLPVLPED